MDFTYDLYISQAKGANLNNWESNLIIFLTTLLERRLNYDIKVICSEDIKSEAQQIEAITNSRSFIVLLTDDYIHSENNVLELENIKKHLQSDKKKIFKVLKSNIPLSNQPEYLQNVLGYNFFEKEIAAEDDLGYNEFMIFEVERQYWTKLTDLTYDIYNSFFPSDKTNSEIAIFLAETTADQERNRESIKRELKRLGFKIFPDKVLSCNLEDLSKEINTYLEKSLLSIHLIGNQYGTLISNSMFSMVETQNKIAACYCEANENQAERQKLSRLIWVNPDLKIANEKQKLFLEKLKRDSEALKGASLIQTPLELFKSLILSEIKNINLNPIQSFSKANKGKRIYLVHESSSFEKISDITSYLSSSGFEIIHSPLLNEERNLLKKHRQNLIECDAVLIYFDSNDEFWLKSKLNDLLKAPGFGRKHPFLAKAVFNDCEYIIPPELMDKKGIMVIEKQDSFSSKQIKGFIEKIQNL